MKKNKGTAYAILAIAFILFNVIVFAIPSVKTTTFWTAYVFTDIAFALQIVIWKFAFNKTRTANSKFLGISLISVGLIYLITQITAFAIFMAFPSTASWIAVVFCSLIFGLSVICLIGTKVGTEKIDRVELNIGEKLFYIKSLQDDVEILARNETNPDTKAALSALAEKIRFSDPMSNETLADIETEISYKIKELKNAKNKESIITVLDSLITERNNKVKLFKRY